MAAPQPMVRPDFYGVRKQNQGEISVFLPRASEEYGPISHYYVIVIPNSNSRYVLNIQLFIEKFTKNFFDFQQMIIFVLFSLQ